MNSAALKAALRRIIILHRGRGKAISAEKLVQILYPEGNYIQIIAGREVVCNDIDDRPVRKAIEELIKEHFPVCSVTEDPPGYFFPADIDEARIYTKSLQKRAVRIFIRRRSIVRDTARYYEQARQEAMV